MVELKREYVIPLRRKTIKAPKWRRSKKAISVIKLFIEKHMKADKIVIGRELNEKVWEKGIKNPPGKVEVVALRKEYNNIKIVFVNLKGLDFEDYIAPYEQTMTESHNKEEDSKIEKEKSVDSKAEEKKKKVDTEVETNDSEDKKETKEKVKVDETKNKNDDSKKKEVKENVIKNQSEVKQNE